MPTWLLLLMAVASTALIAAAVSAGMKAGIWPLAALVSGVALPALIVFGQLAVFQSAAPELSPTVAEAFESALRTRKPWSVIVLFSGIPACLILAGLFALISSRLASGQEG